MISKEMLKKAAAEADQAIRDSLPAPADCKHEFSPSFILKIKPKSDYPLKTLYPRAFQTGQNHLIYYDFTTVE